VAATAVVTEVQAAFPNFANKGLAQAALIALPVLFLSPASQGSGLGATLTSSKVLGLAGVAAVALVKDIPRRDFGKISAVQFRRTDQNLTVGSRSKFLCEKVDERGNTMPVLDDITFASSHPYVVKVDEDGVVEALQVGTATITASIGDKSDLVTVQVARPEEERQGVHPHGTKAS
jgi:hypothetical protein